MLLALVRRHRVAHVVDVRSHPYSRYASHFNRDELQSSIEGCDMRYTSLGSALGGRPRREDQLDADGHALYDRMATEPAVKDIRFFEDDNETIKMRAVEDVHRRLRQGVDAFLMLGLTRPWLKPGEARERHWLQLNGLCLADRAVGDLP
jgi:hypothetical protein